MGILIYVYSDASTFLKPWDRVLEQKPIFSKWKIKTTGSEMLFIWNIELKKQQEPSLMVKKTNVIYRKQS